MPEVTSHVEIMKLTFKHDGDDEPDLNLVRNAADAWMQKKYSDIFMDGYAFTEIYQERSGVIVEYTR